MEELAANRLGLVSRRPHRTHSMRDRPVLLRPARRGDGRSVFELTWASVKGLAQKHYSPEVIANWMGERSPGYYENLIDRGHMIVAEQSAVIIGFVDAEPGEVTRLFILPGAAGSGVGKRLLHVGIEMARRGHNGPVRVEATLNAVDFYKKHGFKILMSGHASHTVGGPLIPVVHMEWSHVASSVISVA
jgi:GNAT superfamily N-acetyltransferase